MPGEEFFEEAKTPPPLYFETDAISFQGVCCVCYKKGVLGRCPNSDCGLLMHHTCVMSTAPGKDQQCPICKTEGQLQAEPAQEGELPFWHQVELGALNSRRGGSKARKMSFPVGRVPTDEEASTLGYGTAKDWYFLYRRSLYETPQEAPSVGVMECEWKALVTRVRADKESDEEDELKEIDEARLMAGAGAALTAVPTPLPGLGTAGGIGRSLVDPQQFANGPLPWKRVQNHSDMRTVLGLTLQKKWSEATSGPPRALPEVLAGGDELFRQKLLLAPGACPDIKPQLQAATKLLEAGSRDRIKEEQELAKSYRLNLR